MRLIDAEALPNYKFNVTVEVGEHKGPAELRVAFWEDIKKAPTIDAVPVVHARWKRHDEDWRHQIAGNECSACGFVLYGPVGSYCPRCGAKMDGGAT